MSDLSSAISFHRAGELAKARALYGRLLERDAADVDALNFSGMLEFQSGNRELGVSLLRRSVECKSDNPHAWLNLGNMLVATAGPAEGAEAYRRALAIDDVLPEAWYNLGVCERRLRRFDHAVIALTRALALRPDYGRGYEALGSLLYKLDRMAEAAAVYRTWQTRDPQHPVARHMAAAMTARDVPARADDDYVTRLFDGFANTFDESLAALSYRAPQLIANAVAELEGYQSGDLDLLDAGCGTGLCGPLLRSTARRLVGVDLSPKMIDRARARQVYDDLVIGELTNHLATHGDAFDVVVSADTLCYFGDLAPVMRAAHQSLRRGGSLVFTVESLPDRVAGGYELQPHGRYAHTEAYVRAVLTESGFQPTSIDLDVLRRERGAEVPGWVVSAGVPV